MISKRELNIFQRALLEVMWFGCYVVGHLPHYVLFYMLAPVVRFIFYRILRYRVAVVDKNLRNSFPQKSDEELVLIRDRFYTYLSETIMSTLILSNKEANAKVMTNLDPTKKSNLEELRDKMTQRSWVALSAHFGLWEYEMFWATYSNRRLVCVYHPLRNKVSEVLFQRLRNHYKALPMPANDSLRFAIRNGKSYRDESYVMGLIADQNPPLSSNSLWYTFLNQDTTFYDGGEKIALRVGMPVYFIYQRRVSPGRYEMCYKLLWDGEESVEPNEITTRYVNALDEAIGETPELWLWSHRRWKRSRQSVKRAAWMKSQKEA